MWRINLFQRALTLIRHDHPSAIPPGWALVPIVPTAQMIQAGTETSRGGVMAMWSRMLEAAPHV